MDPTDPDGGGEPPDVMLDFGAPVAEAEPDPDMIPGAEEVTGAAQGGPIEVELGNPDWLGGLIAVIILFGLLVGLCGIVQGNLALMVACAVIMIVVPVSLFVGVIGWRAGSATKDTNTKGEKK